MSTARRSAGWTTSRNGRRPVDSNPIHDRIGGPLIEMRGVGKQCSRGTIAVRDISRAIRDGEFVSLVGPSCCGRSTVLEMIAGLLTYSAGTITVNVHPPNADSHDMGYVFQDAIPMPWATVRQRLSAPAAAGRPERGCSAVYRGSAGFGGPARVRPRLPPRVVGRHENARLHCAGDGIAPATSPEGRAHRSPGRNEPLPVEQRCAGAVGSAEAHGDVRDPFGVRVRWHETELKWEG